MTAPDDLAARLRAALTSPAGAAALDRAVRAVLRHDGAPTRPDGPVAPLEVRRAAGEPLAEDTDPRAPLGPFRDPDVLPGTLGELCTARLSGGGFAGDLLLALLVPFAREAAADLLVTAVDAADAEERAFRGLATVVGGWRHRPLGELARLVVSTER